MNINFTTDDMKHFLEARGYTVFTKSKRVKHPARGYFRVKNTYVCSKFISKKLEMTLEDVFQKEMKTKLLY